MNAPSIPGNLKNKVLARWKRPDVLSFLEANKEEYDLDDEDIDAIRRNKVSGLDFLELTREFLRDPSGPYKLTDGPAARMEMLISMVKPGRVAREGSNLPCPILSPPPQ